MFEGYGEVVPPSDGADVQPAEEATHPGEGSPGKKTQKRSAQKKCSKEVLKRSALKKCSTMIVHNYWFRGHIPYYE